MQEPPQRRYSAALTEEALTGSSSGTRLLHSFLLLRFRALHRRVIRCSAGHMTKPKAAISWSGGKDCCLALLRAWHHFDIVAMVTMFNEDGERSRSHGLRPALIAAHAARLGLEELSARCSWDTYTDEFISTLARLPERGITHVVFGDIAGDGHREWNERVCRAHGLTPVMPLWAQPTAQLVREFIALGGKARLVTVRTPPDNTGVGMAKSRRASRLSNIVVFSLTPFPSRHFSRIA